MSRAPRVAEVVGSGAVATKRCAIYTRKSTAVGPDVSLSSLDAQRDVCTAYLTTKQGESWRAMPERYDDGGYTGANLERPAFRRLLADITAGKIDVVVVYKVDRLSRSLLDFAQVIRLFERHGVAFVSVTQSFSTADAIGRLVLNLLMSFAEFEREMIAERTRDKVAASRRRGKWTGGPVPFGYRVVDRKLVVDPVTGPIVPRIFEAYLQRRSVLDVVRLLGQLAPRVTKGGTPRAWVRNDVRRILANPVYAGLLRIPRGGVATGEHAALIDRELFEQANPANAPVAAAPRPDAGYLLRGLARCGGCDAAMTGATTRKQRARFRYYRCGTRDRRGREACEVPPVRAGDLEGMVVGQIREAIGTGALGPAVVKEGRRQLDDQRAALATGREDLLIELAGHSHRAEEQARAFEGASADQRRQLEQRLTAAMADAAAVERRLLDVDRELREVDAVVLQHGWVAETLAHFDPVWEALTPTERARLVELLVERVVVMPDRTVDLVWRAFARP